MQWRNFWVTFCPQFLKVDERQLFWNKQKVVLFYSLLFPTVHFGLPFGPSLTQPPVWESPVRQYAFYSFNPLQCLSIPLWAHYVYFLRGTYAWASNNWNLVYALWQEWPKLVYAFWSLQPVGKGSAMNYCIWAISQSPNLPIWLLTISSYRGCSTLAERLADKRQVVSSIPRFSKCDKYFISLVSW